MASRVILTAQSGLNAAKVRFNSEWQVYIVQFFHDGEYQSKADYETTDRGDAIGTAQHWVNKFTGAMH